MSEKINNVEVDIDEEVVRGNYANLAIISHSPTEFVLDFAVMLPGMPKAKVGNRVVVTPEHAKRIFQSLKDNISRYESRYGGITNLDGAQTPSQECDSRFIEIAPKIGEA